MKDTRIFQKSGMKGSSPFMPDASMADVPAYVAQSAKRPAMKPATAIFIRAERNTLNVAYPAKEPMTPMDTILAPQVLKPPWAKKSACISSATAATSTLMEGPRSIADMPVPQGCEQVPAVGTGMGIQEIIKIAAAISPKS